MDIQKINVKFYLEKGHDIEPETWFKPFNTWISQEQEEVLIDVADYSHVPNGPTTLLVGHEANYCIDSAGGKPGLLYARKQPRNGSLPRRLRAAFLAAGKTCLRLEQDPNLAGRVKFRGNEAQLVFNDRLLAPNTEATLEAIREDLQNLLKTLYAGAETTVEHNPDPAARFTLNIRAQGNWEMANLIENL